MVRTWRNYEVTTVALREAGGAEGPVHLEEIAVVAHQLAPERFSWSLPKYDEYPDKDLVRVSLFDAAKDRNRAMVTNSRNESGELFWRLTAKGAEFCAKHEEKILAAHGRAESQSGRKQHRRLLKQVRSSRLWTHFEEDSLEEASEVLLTELLRLPPDSSPSRIAENLDRLRAQVELTRDAETLEFLNSVEVRFESLLSGTDSN